MTSGKSDSAFRTISEVAEALDVKPHVLRFWESKFDEIQPVKRAAGRRYYRPEDVELIAGIKFLLHAQGMTIKGAKKHLKEAGVAEVRRLAKGEKPTSQASLNEVGIDRRSKLEAARQNLKLARILLVGEDN
ncbi:MAG: MerR family transcriptional regulator [PS1 clade bacterium]|uniref:MerR family transcriptional regulator n=1 Tax=PS1 clade bacterium TaxID=2175152 RepID=A0A937HIL3_9PROT|nr:MerR family transcriptional regulator [PS1 clade bacterium]